MRLACSLGPACAGADGSASSNNAAAAAMARGARRRPVPVVMTFMALTDSLQTRRRKPTIRPPATPPRMSQAPDVAGRRQFCWIAPRADDCAGKCEPVHGLHRHERIPVAARTAVLPHAEENTQRAPVP